MIGFENFKDLIFEDDKLSAKTVKITFLENLYIYGICLILTLHNYSNKKLFEHIAHIVSS